MRTTFLIYCNGVNKELPAPLYSNFFHFHPLNIPDKHHMHHKRHHLDISQLPFQNFKIRYTAGFQHKLIHYLKESNPTNSKPKPV